MKPVCSRSRSSAAPMKAAVLFSLAVALAAGCRRGDTTPASAEKLFVTVPERRQLVIYQVGAIGSAAPLQVITENAPDQPVDVTADIVGDAFVVNANGNVRVYAPRAGNYAIFKNYEGSNTQIEHPTAIAVNKQGSFFIADKGDGVGRLEWFSGGANGNLVPDRVIKGPDTGIHDPRGVAIDGSGRVFVTDRASNRVLVFAADANGDATPIAQLAGLRAPGHLEVDDVLNIYVVNEADNSVAIFASNGPESWALTTTIKSKALAMPTGITVDATGEIAVGTTGGVIYFAGNAQGDADPVRTLTGSDQLHPAGICVH